MNERQSRPEGDRPQPQGFAGGEYATGEPDQHAHRQQEYRSGEPQYRAAAQHAGRPWVTSGSAPSGGGGGVSPLSLLGGAVMGAVAMYLLDPETGHRRREHLGEATGDALRGAGERVGPLWDRVSDSVRGMSASLAERAGEGASHLGHRLSDMGSGLADRTRDAGHLAGGAASDAYAGARSHVRTLLGRKEPESHAAAYTAGGLGALALGAGLFYLLDPQRGRQRRAQVMDQVHTIVRQAGDAGRQAGRWCQDLVNRTQGTAHEARNRMMGGRSEGPVNPDQLVQRVRSEMGHVVSRASAIQIMANTQGHVTLTGSVLASEVDRLLSTVTRVPGVTELVNRLDVHDTVEGFDRAQSAAGVPLM